MTVTGTQSQLNNLLTAGGTGTIVYATTQDPSATATVTVTVDDGGATGIDPGLTGTLTSEAGTNSQTINITAVNDNPTLDLDGDDSSGAAVNDFTAAGFAVGSGVPVSLVDGDFALGDVDSATLSSITITVTNALDGADDVLSATGSGAVDQVIFNVGAGSNTLTLSSSGGSASLADFIATLATVTYENTSSAVTADTTTRSITFVVDDGAGANNLSAVATASVGISTPPGIDLDADDSSGATNNDYQATWTEGVSGAAGTGPIAVVDVGDATLVDPDSGVLQSLTLTITPGTLQVGDVLSASISGGADEITFVGGVLTITSSGTTAPVADFLNVLESVRFNNTGESPVAGNRVIEIVATDGVGVASNSIPGGLATSTITVQAVNDAPITTSASAFAGESVNEDTALTFTGGNALTVDDVDIGAGDFAMSLSVNNGTLTLATTAGLSNVVGDGTGTVTFEGTKAEVDAALNGLVYQGNADFNGADTLTIITNDQGGTGIDPLLTGDGTSEADTDTIAITVNAVNDAPVTTSANGFGAESVNEDTALTFTGANALTVADVDIGAGDFAMSLSVNNGTLTLATTAGLSNVVGDGTGTVTFEGTKAEVDAALNGLVYQGNADFNGADTLTIITNDQGGTGIDPLLTGDGTSEADTDTIAITVNAVNDAPVTTSASAFAAESVNEDTALTFTGANALTVDDVDIGAGDFAMSLSVNNGR